MVEECERGEEKQSEKVKKGTLRKKGNILEKGDDQDQRQIPNQAAKGRKKRRREFAGKERLGRRN